MGSRAVMIAAAVSMFVGHSAAQVERSLTIPVAGPAASVRCEYFADLSAENPEILYRGAGDWGRVAKQPGSVVIDTAPVNEPTRRLKQAFVYCPGFGITNIKDIRFGDAAQFIAPPIQPARLRSVRLTGHVLFPPTIPTRRFDRIQVCHSAFWIVESYGTWDGSIPQFQIASVAMNADDSFSVDLPDFSVDSFVSRFRNQGWFEFTAISGDVRYQLEVPDEFRSALSGSGHFGLVLTRPVAPLDVRFVAVQSR